MRICVVFILYILCSACSQSNQERAKAFPISAPIPATATIKDTVNQTAWNKADFFYVAQIGGQPVANSFTRTQSERDPESLALKPVGHERTLPVKQTTLTLFAQTEYGAPQVADAVQKISGSVTFTPKPDETYFVKGSIRSNYVAVWLESSDGQVVTPKIESGQRS